MNKMNNVNNEWVRETVLYLREIGCNKLADKLCEEELGA
jgi:hypothetical protein